jgi:hypothetical protein
MKGGRLKYLNYILFIFFKLINLVFIVKLLRHYKKGLLRRTEE